MYLRVNDFTHTNRMTGGKSFIHSSNCQFFDRLTSYPSDVWVKIVARMNADVFQYKLLVIPSTQRTQVERLSDDTNFFSLKKNTMR